MKKKVLEKLEKKKINIEGLKTLRPLLKGIKVKPKKIKESEMYSSWPITATIDDDTVIKMETYRVGILNKKGFYYCELEDVMEDEKDMVYFAFYSDMKVKELLFEDEEASIEPHSFHSFGMNPDYEEYKFLDKLLPTEENFVEIIDKRMKAIKKNAKKLSKELKNQK